MPQNLNNVIRHLIALTGADPRQARIPQGKHRLQVHTQRVGEVRLITVAPAKRTLPHIDTTALSHLETMNDTVLLQGIVTALPQSDALWLALAGAGALPLVATQADVEQTLRALVYAPVIIQGECSAQGIEVHAVQAVVE